MGTVSSLQPGIVSKQDCQENPPPGLSVLLIRTRGRGTQAGSSSAARSATVEGSDVQLPGVEFYGPLRAWQELLPLKVTGG